MGHMEYRPKKYMNTIADEIDLDDVSLPATSSQAAKENAKGFLKVLGIIAAAIFGIFYIFIKVIIEITKPYYGGKHSSSSYRSFGKHVKKKNSNRCDGDCDNCPAHYGYRYGRWYYGHGHQSGCQRGGNGGQHGLTLRGKCTPCQGQHGVHFSHESQNRGYKRYKTT